MGITILRPCRFLGGCNPVTNRPDRRDRLANPDAVLTRSDIVKLGYERRHVDAIFRTCPVEVREDYSRSMIRVDDFLTWRERDVPRRPRACGGRRGSELSVEAKGAGSAFLASSPIPFPHGADG